MNIFFLSQNPTLCAQYHCDKHVVKMILETAQILCTVLHKKGFEVSYKPTHKNHPCVLWAEKNITHFRWLCLLGIALSDEYTFRYKKTHSSYSVILECYNLLSSISVKKTFAVGGFEEPPLCMPEKYKKRKSNNIDAYRQYYIGEKYSFAKWERGRGKPIWFHYKSIIYTL